LDGVVGVAEGLDRRRPCLLVLVVQLTPEIRSSIPKAIEGYPVKIQATGEMRARKGRG